MIELSVIIPTYDRAELLSRCLWALVSQTAPPDRFEVIVVVDGSRDATREVLANLDVPYQLHIVWQPNRGEGSARNHGLGVATGRWCLFLDDDIVAAPELLAEHLRTQRQLSNELDHVGVVAVGQIELRLGRRADWATREFARGWRKHYAELCAGRAPTFWDCYGGNLSIPRAALLEAGGFATHLPRSFDVELGYRLQRRGLSIVFVASAIGQQLYEKDLGAIAGDAEAEGVASMAMYRRHPALLEHAEFGLGTFTDTGARGWLIRRGLLALRAPPRLLGLAVWLARSGRARHALYQFTWRHAFWRGVRQACGDRTTWRRLTHAPVVLLYHAIGAYGERGSRFVVPRAAFERQMAWLSCLGFRVMSMDELLRCRREHRLAPARAVLITLDDGYADVYEQALPVLRRRKFPATLFIVSGAVGETNGWDRAGPLRGRPLVSWATLHTLMGEGLEIGAHGHSHASLPLLDPEQLAAEIGGARAELQAVLGRRVRTFAYPYGDHNSRIEEMIDHSGFEAAWAVEPGMNAPVVPRFALRRIEVFGNESLLHFALAVWLGHLPRLFRRD